MITPRSARGYDESAHFWAEMKNKNKMLRQEGLSLASQLGIMRKLNMIRKFKQTDIDQIINIWLEASIKAHGFIDSDFWRSQVDDMRKVYIPSAETYVYEESERIKGFVSLYKDTIAAIFVAPDQQGSGIGRQLISKSKEVRKKLNLRVYKENVKSIEFYKKCGFRIEKEQTDIHTGHPELLMTFNSQVELTCQPLRGCRLN